jgi:RNA polymerase sigma-70 factor (ECF subfamily)
MTAPEDKRPALTSTRTLILRVRRGDARAREELAARVLPGLRRWARGRLPGRARALADTDDLVQISLLRALGRVEQFEPRREGAFLAYLHRVLLNCIREEIRRASASPAASPLTDDLIEDRPALLDRTLGTDAVDAYESALAGLPERQQQAVVLRIEFGFTFPEIADILGHTNPDAVRMLVSRGLVRLAEGMPARAD